MSDIVAFCKYDYKQAITSTDKYVMFLRLLNLIPTASSSVAIPLQPVRPIQTKQN
jgi:hypothetical protein